MINANLSDTHAIATKVNSWVNNITNGHIEKMIDDGKFAWNYLDWYIFEFNVFKLVDTVKYIRKYKYSIELKKIFGLIF